MGCKHLNKVRKTKKINKEEKQYIFGEKMKKMIYLFLVMLLSSVSAATVNSPLEIPANINWSFSVELDATNSFTKTEIYFDDLLIVTAFNDKQPVVQEDFVLKAFLFDKVPEDNTGLTVFVSYFGIQEGEHKIKTKTFNKENLVEEKEFELKAIDTVTALTTLPEEFNQEVDLLMKGIIAKINQHKEELEALKQSNEQNLEEQTKILEEEIKQLEASLEELNKIDSAEEQPLEETDIIEGVNQTNLADDFSEKEKANLVTGFYVFTVDRAWYGAVFLIVLLVLLALFQVYKKRSGEEPVFEELLDKAVEEDKAIPAREGDEVEIKELDEIGEESFSEKKEKPKRFSIGDLIKK